MNESKLSILEKVGSTDVQELVAEVRLREEERDVYRAALADLVAGMAGARERAIAALSGDPPTGK